MTYVALLRGINVGGHNRVAMGDLAAVFERAGMGDVRTYINSGNVVFSHAQAAVAELAAVLSAAIGADLGLALDVLVLDGARVVAIAEALTEGWANDAASKCDVMYLWPGLDEPSVMELLSPKPGVDEAVYVPGAVLWRYDRANATKSRSTRVVGTPIYKGITVRNCNTARRLAELVREADTG